MKERIWKKCIKDYDRLTDPEVRGRYTRLTGILGIGVNSLLCLVKIFLGVMIHSIAVIADGLHDMADSLAACITLLAARIARKPADPHHPYGHARAEYLASLAVSLLVLIVGAELLKSSVEKILHPAPTDFSWLMVAFMVFAILLKGGAALFIIATGRHIDSLPVIAAGTDNRNDVITSIIIVMGMLIHHFTGLDLDGYMGCAVSLFILYSGIGLLRSAIHPILGERPDGELAKKITGIVSAHPEILGLHDLMIYNYGPGRNYASFHAEVDARSDLVSIHEVIDGIERELAQKLQIDATCHMDPVDPDDPLRQKLQAAVAAALDRFDAVEGFHDLRISSDQNRADPPRPPAPADRKVYLDIVLADDARISEGELRAAVYNAIRQFGPYRPVITFDRTYLLD